MALATSGWLAKSVGTGPDICGLQKYLAVKRPGLELAW